MVVALLIALGVNIVVVVVIAAFVIGRRRWVDAQPGAFKGALRSSENGGSVSTWRRGYGHWVRDVLIWNRAPLLLVNQITAVDSMVGHRSAQPGEIRRLGEKVEVVALKSGATTIEIAAGEADTERLLGPFTRPDFAVE